MPHKLRETLKDQLKLKSICKQEKKVFPFNQKVYVELCPKFSYKYVSSPSLRKWG